MTRRSIYSILSVILLTILFLLTPGTRMTVNAKASPPTFVVLTAYSKSLSIGDEFYLAAVTSNGKDPSFKSSKSSVASVNTYGLVTAKKAGTCKITAKVKGAEASCKITVMPTTTVIKPESLTLYRTESRKLTAEVSTGHIPVWRSSKSSVAVVDENGVVTAVKHGTARITATVDGTSKSCTVTVKKPKIKLSASKLNLTAGSRHKLSALVSSGNAPEWSSSNMNIADVDETGTITARQKGRAYIYAREDGVKVSCIVTVKEAQQ